MTAPAASSVPAGDFGEWLRQMRAALRGDAGNNVPCGDCVGCCTSSWFVPVRPNETDTLALIPVAALTRTPGKPRGNWLMGYAANGHCAMFRGGGCSIYGRRPQTCRDFDCRIFTATGISAGGDDKSAINSRVQSWAFTFRTADDRRTAAAVRSAAEFIRRQAGAFPEGFAPSAPTGIAALAIKTYELFLGGESAKSEDPARLANRIVDTCREFDRGAP